MMCPGCGMIGGMWMMLLWIGLIVAGIALVVWTISRRGGGDERMPQDHEDRALRTLRERFARGEIDEAEYRERRQLLESHE